MKYLNNNIIRKIHYLIGATSIISLTGCSSMPGAESLIRAGLLDRETAEYNQRVYDNSGESNSKGFYRSGDGLVKDLLIGLPIAGSK